MDKEIFKLIGKCAFAETSCGVSHQLSIFRFFIQRKIWMDGNNFMHQEVLNICRIPEILD